MFTVDQKGECIATERHPDIGYEVYPGEQRI